METQEKPAPQLSSPLSFVQNQRSLISQQRRSDRTRSQALRSAPVPSPRPAWTALPLPAPARVQALMSVHGFLSNPTASRRAAGPAPLDVPNLGLGARPESSQSYQWCKGASGGGGQTAAHAVRAGCLRSPETGTRLHTVRVLGGGAFGRRPGLADVVRAGSP